MALILTGTSLVQTFIADVPIDVVHRRVFSSNAIVTEHPIEDGSSADDHVIDLPDELEIDGSITNTPASALDGFARTRTWAEVEFQKLVDARNAKEPVTVLSGPYSFETYKNEGMIIKSLVRTDGAPEDAVRFSISLRKITKVESATESGASRDENTQTEQQNNGTHVATPI